jgi:hypothetical protein
MTFNQFGGSAAARPQPATNKPIILAKPMKATSLANFKPGPPTLLKPLTIQAGTLKKSWVTQPPSGLICRLQAQAALLIRLSKQLRKHPIQPFGTLQLQRQGRRP